MQDVWQRVLAYLDPAQEAAVHADPALDAAFDCIAAGRVRDLKPQSIARETGYDARTLCRNARLALGVSLTQYLLHYRLGEVARLLIVSDAKVGTIAQLLAFPDRSSLWRAFRKEFGSSPSRFRARERRRAADARVVAPFVAGRRPQTRDGSPDFPGEMSL